MINSKWSRIQDSCRITLKIESLVVCAMPDVTSKFQKDLSITFWVILLTYRQTDKQTKTCQNITFLVEVKIPWMWPLQYCFNLHSIPSSPLIFLSHVMIVWSQFIFVQFISCEKKDFYWAEIFIVQTRLGRVENHMMLTDHVETGE